jgi:type IV pilus assembly protein PilP
MKMLRLLLAPALVAALGTTACGDDAPAAKTAQPSAKKAPAAAAASPEKAAVETALAGPAYQYAYNPIGKRDPFRSPLGEVQKGTAGQGVCSEPLCQWDLDQLTLVAVVTGSDSPVAMVEDPQGIGYIVHRNARIGKQGGKVSSILKEAITVTEFWTAPDGKTTPNVINVGLKKDSKAKADIDLATGKSYE